MYMLICVCDWLSVYHSQDDERFATLQIYTVQKLHSIELPPVRAKGSVGFQLGINSYVTQ